MIRRTVLHFEGVLPRAVPFHYLKHIRRMLTPRSLELTKVTEHDSRLSDSGNVSLRLTRLREGIRILEHITVPLPDISQRVKISPEFVFNPNMNVQRPLDLVRSSK